MAAQQIVGTPAPAAAEPAASAESHGIDSILGDLTDLAGAEATEDDGSAALDALSGNEAPAEPETPEAQPDKAQRLDDDVIFSDAALSTKEGVLKAAARAKQLRQLGHQKYLELKAFEKRVAKRNDKLQHSIQKHVTSKQNDMLLVNNVRSNVQALHSSDPETIVNALGNLTGMDGLKAYELITSHIVNRGPSKVDPQVQGIIDGLRNELAELKGGLNQRDEQAKLGQVQQQIGTHVQNIQRQVLNSTTTPHLARIMRDDPNGLTDLIVNEITKSNGTIPAPQLYERMESELRAHFGAVAPSGDSGGPAPKQPTTAQRSPLGQSIGPRSTAAATPRVPSEDEALKALASDDEFMRQFGL
jgi:hypothetical protein